MTVTFLTSYFPVGSEQFITNQVVGLLEAGHEVQIISLHTPKQVVTNDEYERLKLYGKVEYIHIPRKNELKPAALIGLVFSLLCTAPLKLIKAFNFFNYHRAVFSFKTLYLLKHFRRRKIDLLHCHFGPNGIVGSFLKDIGVVDTLVATFHGSDINSYPLRYGKNVYNRLFEVVDRITVNTDFTGDKVISYGADPDKIDIVPVGLKCTEYPYLKDTGFKGAPVVLSVARLEEKKGLCYSLQAFASVLEKYPNAEYHIAGEGSQKAVLQQLVKRQNIEERVVFHGFCDRMKLFELYRKATVFVLPSVTAKSGDMEGQGLVLQEAQAVGLPVITTLHNGIPDGVLDGKSGFLLPERDSEGIAMKIIYLAGHPSEAGQMGKTGREFVMLNYDIPRLTEKVKATYLKAMSNCLDSR